MHRKMNNSKWLVKNFAVIVFLFLSNVVLAGGGDHDVPTPFDTIDSRFELADKGFYTLKGQIVFFTSQMDQSEMLRPYLHLNLEKYPWLANEARIKFPYYPLEGDMAMWKKYSTKVIKLMCRAHGQLIQGAKGPEYFISLEPVLPIVLD